MLFSDLKQRMKSLRLGAGTKNDARDLGREFASAVDAIVERIVTSPLAFPCAHGETRRAVLRRTHMPYTFAYWRMARL